MHPPEESAGRCLAPFDGVAASHRALQMLPRMHEKGLRHGGIFRGLLQPSMTSDIVASGKHTHAGLLHSMVQGHAQTSRHDRTISALVRESEGTWIDSSISWS